MEAISTDTVFASVTALNGETCFQVYYSMTSFFTEVYGVTTEAEGSTTRLQYIKERGALSHIHNDNSKMQTSKAWNDICNQYLIQTSTTEPHQPQQNPCERRIQTIKSHSKAIMDISGAPPSTWFYCTCYVVDLLNHTAHPKLIGGLHSKRHLELLQISLHIFTFAFGIQSTILKMLPFRNPMRKWDIG